MVKYGIPTRAVYTKTAVKDIPKLRAAPLDAKAKALIGLLWENPYQTPPAEAEKESRSSILWSHYER